MISAFTSFDDKICSNDQQDLVPKPIVDHQFYTRQLFTALVRKAKKIVASVIAQAGGGSGF
jgi:Mor family transcriptional regulator